MDKSVLVIEIRWAAGYYVLFLAVIVQYCCTAGSSPGYVNCTESLWAVPSENIQREDCGWLIAKSRT